MNTIKRTFLSLLCLVFFGYTYSQTTETLLLSGNDTTDGVVWDFFCTSGQNSGKWSKIRVPSCWELEGFGEYNYGYEKNKASEKGIYRTTFTIPDAWKNKRIFIVFDGSMTDTKIMVNGKQAGDIHQGSFYRFKREITKLVTSKAGNKLEVEVCKKSANASVNSAERDADFWVFGGIYRPVYLEAVPNTFIEYSAIDAKHDGAIRVNVALDKKISNANVSVDIFEANSEKKVGSFTSETTQAANQLTASSLIADVKMWSAETPHLYDALITVTQKGRQIHTIKERFGFRTIELNERDGIYINNQKIRFKGVNRHCFWPTTGRTVTRQQSLNDAMLIKEMNMNAVRMAHYPPDKHFLELCDSIGLYVINELCSWQKPPYDTQVGTILATEMVKRDINHPSIILWANGNEGGFNTDLDTIFPQLDIQKRPVIHPFALFGGINTAHYITYNSGIKNMFNGRDVFMPTELLHGLYDGGHGAGLDDFWNLMLSNPLSAGMFLWDFSDQGVVRTDKGGVLDTDKASGADGIVGPYREKEGSFYTIKEIWSPVFVEKKYITPQWNGILNIENRYDFTNTSECSFRYKLTKFASIDAGDKEEINGSINSPEIAPGNKGKLAISLPANWKEFDVLYLTATDPNGYELFTWSYELHSPAFFANRMLKNIFAADANAAMSEDASSYTLSANGTSAKISKTTGLLTEVTTKNNGIVPLANGPVFVTNRKHECKKVSFAETPEGLCVEALYQYERGGEAYRFSWTMQKNGVLQLDYNYRPKNNVEMAGVTFDFPEKDIRGAKLFANGPYRVYNNRLKGGTLNIWDKEYNDAITGETWEYPEFKGYYSLFHGMKLICPTPFEIYCASEDVFLHLFTPTIQQQYDPKKNYTHPSYPAGNISFMDAIPSVGTKFETAEHYGPQSQWHRFKEFSGTPNMNNRIYFKFE